ncbi:MAG: sigma-70 family RNA polymerase sigma factor [Blastocatellia bacterium]
MFSVPTLEAAYGELRPSLVRVLARLARQGFVVSPVDSLDLIHDFFTEAWLGLAHRYDSSRGSFQKYACNAFVHFARPRIIELRRVQGILVDPLLIADQEDEHIQAQALIASAHDIKIVMRALGELPPLEHVLLIRYFCSEKPSQRQIATRFEISRYRVKVHLATGLGRLVASLDKPQEMGEMEWKVARALWRDWRTEGEAARLLGMTEYQVKQCNTRNLQFVSSALTGPEPSRIRRTYMSAQTEPFPSDLLRQALESPGDEDLLRELRVNADAVLDAIEASRPTLDFDEMQAMYISPTWLAQVYEALSPSVAEEAIDESWFNATDHEEGRIGSAYSEALLAGLPPEIRNLNERLAAQKGEPLDWEEIAELLQSPSVTAGGDEAERIARHGVTPLTIFYATEAVSLLLKRSLDAHVLANGVYLSNANGQRIGRPERTTDPKVIEDEITKVAECTPEVASVLYRWLLSVLQYKHYLLRGFRAETEVDGVILKEAPEPYVNLFERWAL